MDNINNKLAKIFEEMNQVEYEKYSKDNYYYPAILSVFHKKLLEVNEENLFKLVKFFGWYSNDELLRYYFENIPSVKNLKILVNKAQELVDYLNSNSEKFTYSSDKAQINFLKKEWKKTNQISTVWKQAHAFLPTENILSILLYPIYKLDINSFINLWQKIELPFYAFRILYECDISIAEITKKPVSQFDIIFEKGKWNKKFSVALLLEYAFTQMFNYKQKYIFEENLEQNGVKQYIEDNYVSLINTLCQRVDANFIFRNWFKYVVQDWPHKFSEYKEKIPYIISIIIKIIQRNNKNVDDILDFENADDEDIQPLLLAKIYSEDKYDFDPKYINFLFKSYENQHCVLVYQVPAIGYMREDILYLGQLLVGIKDSISVWKEEWKKLEFSRMQSRYQLNSYDLLNSSLFHILIGLSACNYLFESNPETALLLLNSIWIALKELYFFNGYINSLHIEGIMLYTILMLLEVKIPEECLEKIKFISDNLKLFVRLINQKKYTDLFVELFDKELIQKVLMCDKISKLYHDQNVKYVISNKKLLQNLGKTNV